MLSSKFLEREAKDLKARLSEAVELAMLRASAEDDYSANDLHNVIDMCVESLTEVSDAVADYTDDEDEDTESPWFNGENN